jgi:hypothetical protein
MDDLEKNYNEEFFEKEGITWDKNAEDALKKQINYIKIL